ncbi:hypothetical protein C7I85_03645 [Mesorhizobium soli]|uniref:HTH araC/xylS-type domain-containing protein n=1 Tax=Pseudaminobacter soli (ex Li et al. 2025) TaxID=1295366 RepID=A0A2P7SK29_9HYPH|nr:hypothetical protein C7I85_03645 [Mesorhizobium soli]
MSRAETGLSLAKAIEDLRLEATRFMLEHGRLSIEEIARETGFGEIVSESGELHPYPRRHAPSPSNASAGDHLTVR